MEKLVQIVAPFSNRTILGPTAFTMFHMGLASGFAFRSSQSIKQLMPEKKRLFYQHRNPHQSQVNPPISIPVSRWALLAGARLLEAQAEPREASERRGFWSMIENEIP